MGSRIQKIAFIIFALLFVAIMAVMNSTVLNLGTNGNKQLSTTLQTSDTASLEVYNDATVAGSTVLSAAKNPSSVSSTALKIGVLTKAAASDSAGMKVYISNADSDDNKYSTSDSSNTINAGAQFHSYLCYNDNGVVTGIAFVQDGVTTEEATSSIEAVLDGSETSLGTSCPALSIEGE